MELFAISGLINALTAVSFGVLVLFKNWRNRQNQIFFLMTGSLAIWGIAYWQWLKAVDYESALLWVRILAVGSVFIPTFFLDWIVQLMNKPKEIRNFVSLAYLVAIAVALFANTEHIISGLSQKLSFPFWPDPGMLYTIYFWLLYIGVVFYSIHTLYHGYLEEKNPQRRGQLLYILWGAVLGFGGGFTNFLLWYGIPIPPYGTFLVAAFPFLLGFSVVRHGLFNAKSIATEILVFFIGVILFIQFVLSGTMVEYLLRGAFFVLVVFFGILLIKSVYREVEQREQIEELAKELEKTNASLEAANERLKELDQLKSEFVSLATHQIRGPITAIKGYASMLLEGDYGAVPEVCKKPVETILQSSSSLAGIVQDFLDVSRIEQGKMKYEFSEFDVSNLVTEVAAELKPNIEKKGLALALDIEPHITVCADSGKLKQVIENLLDNAVKYTREGSISVSLYSSKVERRVMFAVKDTGIGITQETLPHLFQKFSRAEDASKANIKGTGLGLYVARQLVEAQGGRIWVESAGENKGSIFYVELGLA